MIFIVSKPGKDGFKTTADGMRSIKPFVLPRLQRIVNARSVKEYQQAVSDLKESDEWKADT